MNSESQAGADGSGIELAAAIQALRDALVRATLDGSDSPIKFRLDPVELTVQVGVTRTGKGSAGIAWHVLSLGGERSKESASTQTLTLRLTPVLFDRQGLPRPDTEQLISDLDEGNPGSHDATLPAEPE